MCMRACVRACVRFGTLHYSPVDEILRPFLRPYALLSLVFLLRCAFTNLLVGVGKFVLPGSIFGNWFHMKLSCAIGDASISLSLCVCVCVCLVTATRLPLPLRFRFRVRSWPRWRHSPHWIWSVQERRHFFAPFR